MSYWWKEAKIYELYVDKFAGDFRGLTKRLDYFTRLGINTLHILPHYPSPMIDDGYDIMDYRGVRSELGTLDDFTAFTAAAHEHGIRVILDFVLNHVSAVHPWFIEAHSSRVNPKRDYFLWSDSVEKFHGSINAFPGFKPSNWIANPATGDYYYATFYAEQPDLNWDNPDVLRDMLAVMDFWIVRGADGFRLDAAPHLIKRDGTDSDGLPETHQILKKIRAYLDKEHPGVILLAEAHQSVPQMQTYFGNGDECHMAYHFGLMEKFWLSIKGQDPSLSVRMVESSFTLPSNCQWATFLRNHDEISLATLSKEERVELVSFLDPETKYPFPKIEARGPSTSMRVAEVFHGDTEKILVALKLLYETAGAPVMYYGDEIGMRNLPPDPRVIDTRKFVRGAFDWDEAERQMKDPNSLLRRVALLITGTVGQ